MSRESTSKTLAKQLLEVIPPVMHILRVYMREAAASELTIPQFRILANINRGLATISEIAQHHGVSQPAMSRMVEGLEEKGLILRKANPSDRRMFFLKLTPEGKKFYSELKAKSEKRIAERLNVLSDAQMNEVLSSLTALQSLIHDVGSERA